MYITSHLFKNYIYTHIFFSLCSIILFELLLTLFCYVIRYCHIPHMALMKGLREIKLFSVLYVEYFTGMLDTSQVS